MRIFISLVCVSVVAACSTTPRDNNRFSGTFGVNEAESITLPGQHFSADFLNVQLYDGKRFQLIQTFTVDGGQKIEHRWNGVCDDKPTPAEGSEGFSPPDSVTLSCLVTKNGAMNMTLADKGSGYRHAEVCMMSADAHKQTCTGTATLPGGS